LRRADDDDDDEATAVAGEEGAGDATATITSAEIDAAEVHYLQLESLGVAELRRRLREARPDNTELSKVSKSDLSAQDLATADAKKNATLELLRRRLAAVYTEKEIVSSSPSPNDDMIE
jgi:hypothetical protein